MRLAQLTASAAAFCVASLSAGDILLFESFGDSSSYSPIASQEAISGSLPKGWLENCSWSKTGCKFSPETEGSSAFLRMSGEKRGTVQLVSPLDCLVKEKSCFKLLVKARSSSSSALNVIVRDLGAPYKAHGMANLPLEKDWKEVSFMVSAEPSELKQCLALRWSSPGCVEVASVKMEPASLADYAPLTAVPQQRDARWAAHVAAKDAEACKVKPAFLIMGDSITQGWLEKGRKVWDESIAPFGSLCDGIGGDRVENLLWRVKHMPGLGKEYSPKLIAVLIGVNNSWNAMPEDVAAGLSEILKELRARTPSSKILVIGVFPRDEKPSDSMREVVKRINFFYAKAAERAGAEFYDFGDAFLSPDGSISKDVMPDFLHPNESGYRIYASKLAPKVKELMAGN